MRTVLAVAVVLAAAPAAADPPKNAALHYWQAFALMPDRRELTDEEFERLDTPRDEWPLDATTTKFVERHDRSLAYLHRGAGAAACRWGDPADLGRDGIAPLPHLGRAWTLRDVLLLRVRDRFARGRVRPAADDLLALVRFGRHLEPGASYLGFIASVNTESRAAEALAAHLGAVAAEPGLLARVRREWVAVRPPRSLRAAHDEERDRLVRMFRTHADIDPDDPPPDFVGRPAGAPGTMAYFFGAQAWPDAVRTFCDGFGRLYDRWGTLMALPPGEIDAAEERMARDWVESTAGEEPLAAFFAHHLRPACARLRKAECRGRATRALLLAALAVAAGGVDELNAYPDPFGDGPFRHTPTTDGFELESALSRAVGERVVLRVTTARPRRVE